jgi:hypothetical protein
LERPNRGHLIDAYNKYAANNNRAVLPASVRSPRVDRGSWPIDDIKKTNVFIIGALTDFWLAYQKDNKKTEISQLMVTWAREIFGIMNRLREETDSDVFFLGTGVAPDNKKFGPYIHFFNFELLRIIKDNVVERKVSYPRLYFHDIYSPEQDETWDLFEKTASTKNKLTWKAEPDSLMDRFYPLALVYMQHQCIASAERRYARDDESKVKKESRKSDSHGRLSAASNRSDWKVKAGKKPPTPKKFIKKPVSPRKPPARRDSSARRPKSTTPKRVGKAEY